MKKLGKLLPIPVCEIPVTFSIISRFPTRPSAWCVAFNKKQLDVLEYAQDLRQYFANGYGNEDVSNRLGCGILKEMYQRLKRGVEGNFSNYITSMHN